VLPPTEHQNPAGNDPPAGFCFGMLSASNFSGAGDSPRLARQHGVLLRNHLIAVSFCGEPSRLGDRVELSVCGDCG
jgi:hypothetical protein